MPTVEEAMKDLEFAVAVWQRRFSSLSNFHKFVRFLGGDSGDIVVTS